MKKSSIIAKDKFVSDCENERYNAVRKTLIRYILRDWRNGEISSTTSNIKLERIG